ncbi:YndM family protein [Ornithinibacillus scapharcae]|uniref:YndM family protein n=1 Tax=Ornithinibacillus scapharcae TaxID=1147159 RepID=UPI000225B6BC|nr:YndM family protein [Ornithinibacillus scapharcae]
MKHVIPLLIKFVLITAVLWVVLGIFYNVSIGDIFLTSIILSVVSYLADVFVLPNVSNFWATIGDFGLTFLGVWLLGQLFIGENTNLADASLISAFFIALGEILYHRYMKRKFAENEFITLPKDYSITRMQTEFSSELDEKDKY